MTTTIVAGATTTTLTSAPNPSNTGGSAVFISSTLKVGTTPVKAVYAGDSDFGKSQSKAVKQVVQ